MKRSRFSHMPRKAVDGILRKGDAQKSEKDYRRKGKYPREAEWKSLMEGERQL